MYHFQLDGQPTGCNTFAELAKNLGAPKATDRVLLLVEYHFELNGQQVSCDTLAELAEAFGVDERQIQEMLAESMKAFTQWK